MNKDLKWIKKHYGEKMMHLCRKYLYQLLEIEGLVPKLLSEHISAYRGIAEDIEKEGKEIDFKNFMFSFAPELNNVTKEKSDKSAVELLSDAGYILFPECKSEKEIQQFKRFYEESEVICTIKNGGRLETSRVWFAVKKNVAEIKRGDFTNPRRQDEYGTSVISIQFSRHDGSIKITNRYNHSVEFPDNTFYCNLENIIPGLTDAFERDYGVADRSKADSWLELEGYVYAEGKFYKANKQMRFYTYCTDNIIVENGKVIQLPNHQMLVDYFIFDFKNNTVSLYDSKLKDSFIESLGEIEKLEFLKESREIVVKVKNGKDVIIQLDENRQIIGYHNENVKEVGYGFLMKNTTLERLSMPNLTVCDNYFLQSIKTIKEIDLPSLTICGNSFMFSCINLEKLNLPKLRACGEGFLKENLLLSELNLPMLEKCGSFFISDNKTIKTVQMPNLVACGTDFLASDSLIENVWLPKLKTCGSGFLEGAMLLTELSLPSLESCDGTFLFYNTILKKLDLPNLEVCGSYFLANNSQIEELSLPKMQYCGDNFLEKNMKLKKLHMPLLRETGRNFLYQNTGLKQLDLPELLICGSYFLSLNETIKKVNLTKLRVCGAEFLSENQTLKELRLPCLTKCGRDFLCENTTIEVLGLDSLKNCPEYFLYKNKAIKKVYMPQVVICDNDDILNKNSSTDDLASS